MSKIDEQFKVAVVDYHAENAPKQFTDSLKKTGFVVLTNHPVSNELIQNTYSEWRGFMTGLHKHAAAAQYAESSTSDADDNISQNSSDSAVLYQTPEQDNLAEKYYHNKETQDGYFPMTVSEKAKGAKVKDLKHYYQCYFPHGKYPKEHVSDNAENLWRSLVGLGRELVCWIDDHMPTEVKKTIQEKIGADKTLADFVSDERTMLRILHYPGYRDDEQEIGAVRAAAHEDINLITVLPAGSSRGLQVKSNQSGEWYEVPLVEGSIIINIGDMLQEMSEHAYISTTHRVIKMAEDCPNTTRCALKMDEDNPITSNDVRNCTEADFLSNDRMSTPCFIHFKADTPLSERYKDAEEYLFERLVELGVKSRSDKK